MSKPAQIRFRDAEVLAAPEPPRLAVAARIPAPTFDLGALSSDAARTPLQARESLGRRLLATADVVAVTATLVAVMSQFGIGSRALASLVSGPDWPGWTDA